MKKERTKKQRIANDNKKAKARYKIENWPVYNRAMRRRGGVILELPGNIKELWYAVAGYKAGRPYTYSDAAVETVLTIQAYLRLPLRAMQGFIEAWFAQGGLDLKCPDYTTLCRRRKTLNIRLRHMAAQGPLHLVIDGTGLKISGEGEWKRRIHGTGGKRRGWRKLHLALDALSYQVVGKVLTDKDTHDSEVFAELMRQAAAGGRSIKSVRADGAYDTTGCYNAAQAHKAVLTTPPRRCATVQCPHIITRHYNPALAPRDDAIRRIHELGGDDAARAQWKKETGYHQRSLAETGMFRRKTLFAPRLSTKTIENQQVESLLTINAMNKLTSLGMPRSVKRAA
jgi:IS5 family transposase